VRVDVCACVCKCEREQKKERNRKKERQGDTQRKRGHVCVREYRCERARERERGRAVYRQPIITNNSYRDPYGLSIQESAKESTRHTPHAISSCHKCNREHVSKERAADRQRNTKKAVFVA